eukprot:TRINITY_DN7218_c0_g1_i1.p1 TRINITY_DN7218_c0_g1~~TRINITY_DN7218_c0_g1_i1.p1  ORF type:complete len:257 (+),score=69.78 TRINITY_DN7218_c0_g1_i1:99-773(+)
MIHFLKIMRKLSLFSLFYLPKTISLARFQSKSSSIPLKLSMTSPTLFLESAWELIKERARGQPVNNAVILHLAEDLERRFPRGADMEELQSATRQFFPPYYFKTAFSQAGLPTDTKVDPLAALIYVSSNWSKGNSDVQSRFLFKLCDFNKEGVIERRYFYVILDSMVKAKRIQPLPDGFDTRDYVDMIYEMYEFRNDTTMTKKEYRNVIERHTSGQIIDDFKYF